VRERKKKAAEGGEGAPQWVVTYGDMMSLLLTFFILLVSFSTINEEEFNEALESFRGAVGILPYYETLIAPRVPMRKPAKSSRRMEQIAREMQRRMQVLGLEQEIQIEEDYEQGGLKISLPSHVLFDTAKADLRLEAYEVLSNVAEVLREIPSAAIEVQGHTDIRPLRPGAQFADNWDLSYFRAKSVMFYLRHVGGLDHFLIEAVACGPAQPIATNETEEGMQANRRVELFVRGDFPEETREDIQERIRTLVPGVSEPTPAPEGAEELVG